MSYSSSSRPTDSNELFEDINHKRKYSITDAFNSFQNNSPSPFDFGGRSYVSMSHRASINNINSPAVYSGLAIHEQTANLANIGVTDDTDEDAVQSLEEEDTESNEEIYHTSHTSTLPTPIIRGRKPSQYTPLITKTDSSNKQSITSYVNDTDNSRDFSKPYEPSNDLETSTTQAGLLGVENSFKEPIGSTQPSLIHQYLLKPVHYLPAVFLGTLLNILDGLSYGMIMFPVSESVFASLAPAGLSMFYMSCIVSQLIYSLGGSAFKSGIGSEMIEVTPFFHTMALSIAAEMTLNQASQDAIIATTITSYALSSIVTGLVFWLLGKLKLGALVGFFPRHILVGCIGGVGYFLVATGIEVSSRLEGGLIYNYDTFKYLFYNPLVFLEWTVPLALALLLILLQHKYHNSLLVPLFFMAVFILFHLILLITPGWNLESARKFGWVFPSVEDNEPWYGFYSLYKFHLVDWWAVVKQFPSMLALTFFGILHVPINVPALAVTVGMDEVDVDRELVAHGYSNALSGLVGSIQNYLVYTNSVLFIRAGAHDRLAGVLLAVATGAVMMTGPVVIGYIPVCVVGSLIYLLGYELLKESVYDTWGRLRKIEYSTIIIIVLTMGAFDFVIGILVGILLACLSFVVEAGRSPVVQAVYSGAVARSTVLRHPKQQEFLKNVGDQICVIKLQGTIFFGSIGGVERAIREKFEQEIFKLNPIKFLIIDMKSVSSIDFSAAEGFRRIFNLTNEFNTQLIISSIEENGDIIKGLRDAGFGSDNDKGTIELFGTLNYALEWCENAFLKTYKTVKRKEGVREVPLGGGGSSGGNSPGRKSIFSPQSLNNRQLMNQAFEIGTPRTTQVYQAATRTIYDEQKSQTKYYSSVDSSFKKQPLPLIMITFQGLSDKDEEFWSGIAEFFVKEKIPEDYQFYNTSKDKPTFFIVESGLVRSIFKFEHEGRELHASILPMTAFGDLFEMGQQPHNREVTFTTVNDSVIWKLSDTKRSELLKTPNGPALYNELLQIQNKLIRERFDTMTANLVISG
ncbi:sulfate transporter Sulfate/bicarbonate/oxalate exchanger SAT-1 and related transporter [Scheffersomyces amazonensis]|uniref:sulfate transporter Sulfate/bicarbonate/oxalate exchanger SAT-1 and related transporter n=1 Tax=Scheffersomyces amazonensis TaxID=1078765 RepID=UPI00315DC2C4